MQDVAELQKDIMQDVVEQRRKYKNNSKNFLKKAGPAMAMPFLISLFCLKHCFSSSDS